MQCLDVSMSDGLGPRNLVVCVYADKAGDFLLGVPPEYKISPIVLRTLPPTHTLSYKRVEDRH